MKALVIDDSSLIRRIVRQALEERLGLTVAEAEDVGDALDRLAWGEPPGLIVTDIHMPGLDGISLIRRLRLNDHTPRVPILVLSVEALDSDAGQKAEEAGATAFLGKPFRLEEFIATVRSLLPAP